VKVTTGGVTVAVGELIVGTLGVAGVKTLRDENDTTSEDPACVSQSRAVAQQAQATFMKQYLEPDFDSADAWVVGVGLSDRTAANDAIESSEEVGFGGSDRLPESVGDDVVLLVLYDHTKELPSLPACIADTPVAYVGSGGPAQLD
jgi:hypothetical protein